MVETTVSKIALGSVQWGMTYGVANVSGQPGHAELARMLSAASTAAVSLIDTAYSYGKAEEVIGELADHASGFAIVTKTGPTNPSDDAEAAARRVRAAFDSSLNRLRRTYVDGLLVHNADALLGPSGGRIWEVLTEAKSHALTRKIGVSVYGPHQLEAVMARYNVDIVQLPFNIYDRRFRRSGALAAARNAGIEVHVRSAFLQGLLLMDASKLPPYFEPIRDHHSRFQSWCREREVTPLRAALRFALENSGADKVVVGAENESQLREILLAAHDSGPSDVPDSFEISELEIVNPSQWKL